MALVAGYEGIFDADDLNGNADNSAITTISIGSNSATQASSGSRATLRKSRKNGKSAIEFDGSNDFYDFSDIFDLRTNNLQIFIYAKFVGGTFFAKSGGLSAGRYGFYKYSGALEAFYEGPSSVIADSSTLSADTDFHLYEFQINRVTGKLRCYRDATLIVDASFTPDLATDRDTSDTFTLGKYSTASPLPFEGEIAYIVPYLRTTEFSGGELTQNRDYINGLFTPPDPNPPTVSITSPSTGGASISGNQNIVVTCADDIHVTQLDLLVDSVIVDTFNDSNITGHTFTLDTLKFANGSKVIKARASDGFNSTDSSTITKTFANTFTLTGDDKLASSGSDTYATNIPSPTWSKDSGGGSVNASTGEYVAPSSGIGVAVLRATGEFDSTQTKNVLYGFPYEHNNGNLRTFDYADLPDGYTYKARVKSLDEQNNTLGYTDWVEQP